MGCRIPILRIKREKFKKTFLTNNCGNKWANLNRNPASTFSISTSKKYNPPSITKFSFKNLAILFEKTKKVLCPCKPKTSNIAKKLETS